MNPSEFLIKIRSVLEGNGFKAAGQQLNAVTEITHGMLTGVTAVRRATEEFDRALVGLTPVELQALNQGFEMLRAEFPPTSAEAEQLTNQIKSVDAALDKAGKNNGLSGAITKAADAARALPVIGPVIDAITNPAVAAAAGVGLLAFRMNEAAGKADDLQDKAERFGVSAKTLQTIGNTAGLDGTGIDSVTTALGKLTQTTQAAANGSKPLNEAFERLGLAVGDIKDMSPEQVFLEVADAVANATDKNQAYADVVAVMGRGAGELFATLQRGKAGILETGEAFGGFADDATIKRLADAKENLEKLNNQFTMFAGNFAGDALNLGEKFSTKPIESYVAAVSGLVSQLSGGLLNPDGLSQLDWLKEKLGIVEESAPHAAAAIAKIANSTDDLDAKAAADLAAGVREVEEASQSAEQAVSDLANAASELDQLTQKLQDVQKEAELAEAKRNRDSGGMSESEYQAKKAEIENKYRELEASQEQSKLADEIATKEASIVDLKSKVPKLSEEAKAKAEEELVTRAKEVEILKAQLAVKQQINGTADKTADANSKTDVEKAANIEQEKAKKEAEAKAAAQEKIELETKRNQALAAGDKELARQIESQIKLNDLIRSGVNESTARDFVNSQNVLPERESRSGNEGGSRQPGGSVSRAQIVGGGQSASEAFRLRDLAGLSSGASTKNGVTSDRLGNLITSPEDAEATRERFGRHPDGSLPDSRLGGRLNPPGMPRQWNETGSGKREDMPDTSSATATAADALKKADKKRDEETAKALKDFAAISGTTGQQIIALFTGVISQQKLLATKIGNLEKQL